MSVIQKKSGIKYRINRQNKTLLLFISLFFGLLYNFNHLLGLDQWLTQLSVEYVVVISEVVALGYILAIVISFINIFFKEHRNMVILFLNIFFLLITLGIILSKGY